MEFLLYVLAGGAVGFAVGLTGVGGGSLMTPMLLLFGFPPQVAVGTDLLYAAITKSTGIVIHARRGTIRWRIVALMAAGSLPAAMATAWLLGHVFHGAAEYGPVLTSSLGGMLIFTALVLMFRNRIQRRAHKGGSALLDSLQRHRAVWTVVIGLLLGSLVTLSSVGAGAIGTAVLLVLYPRLPSVQVVGTDLAHADWMLLAALLVGSLPGIYLGTHAGTRLPDRLLNPLLVSILMLLGIKYALF